MATDIDSFAASLLEEAKRFLEKTSECAEPGCTAYLHASLMLAFCSLDAHINAVAEEMLVRSELSAHDKGVLLEREVRLERGEFQVLNNRLHMYPSDERIAYLHLRFAGKPIDHTAIWWSQLKEAIGMRNKLTHPKNVTTITPSEVKRALEAIIGAIDFLYLGIYGTPFPAKNRGLQSKLDF